MDLVFQSEMGGGMSASADYTYLYGQADAVLSVILNGQRVTIARNAKSFGDSVSSDSNPGRVQIVLGTPFAVSAGITSFMLFTPGAGGALIPEWNLVSEAGQFGFYTAVPAPPPFGSSPPPWACWSRR